MCPVDAWRAGMELREAWGLLASFLIFRMSLISPMLTDTFLKPLRAKPNTFAFLQTFPILALNLYAKLKYIFSNLLTRLWS